jgi:FAD/FMN-containing dehydrogenase
LNRFRGEREGNEGVGRDDREVFLRGWGCSGFRTNFRMPLFRLCFLEGVSIREFRSDEGSAREFRKGNVARVSVDCEGYMEFIWDIRREETESEGGVVCRAGGNGKFGREVCGLRVGEVNAVTGIARSVLGNVGERGDVTACLCEK